MTYGFTDAELDLAKHTDLLSLLPPLGYTLKRIGSYYTTAEMDSICIRDPTRWKRYSTRQSGDAITFLQNFCGMRFPEAVDHLLAYHGRSRDSPDRNKPVPRPKPPPPKRSRPSSCRLRTRTSAGSSPIFASGACLPRSSAAS